MKQLTKIIAAASIAASTFMMPTAANAAWDYCHNSDDGSGKVCGYAGERFDVIKVNTNGKSETMLIQCRSSDVYSFRSWGDFTQAQAESMAEAYCEGHGGGHRGADL